MCEMRKAAPAIAIALLLQPSVASAQVAVRASMTPAVVSFPETRAITYRLEILTREVAERLKIGLRLPVYPGRIGAPRASGSLASPITLEGTPTLDGPGGIVDHSAGLLASIGGVPPSECARGYDRPVGASVTLAIPARTTTALVVRARTGRSAPFVGTDYRLAFVVPRSRGRSDVVRPPKPLLRGRMAVRLVVNARPTLARKGAQITISGSTAPPLRGRRVVLRFAQSRPLADGRVYIEGPQFPYAFGAHRTLAVVETDHAGRFSYRAVLRRSWLTALWAVFGDRLTRHVATRSCNAYVGFR